MKDLVSKEHYSYKIHTLLMESSAYPSSIDNSPCMDYPPLLQENLGTPLPWFLKNPSLPKNKGGVHTMALRSLDYVIFCSFLKSFHSFWMDIHLNLWENIEWWCLLMLCSCHFYWFWVNIFVVIKNSSTFPEIWFTTNIWNFCLSRERQNYRKASLN